MDYLRIGHWSVQPVSTGMSTQEPLDVEDVRNHLRESDTADAVIAPKIAVARQRIENRTLRPMLRAQFDFAFERFPCDGQPIRLPRMPAVSVERVTLFDSQGSSQDFGSSGWFLDTYSEPGRLCLNYGYLWPIATRPFVGGVIRFTAGYTTMPGEGIPDPLLEAVRKLATDLYENREASSLGNSVNEPLPYGIEEMIADYLLPEVY